MSNQPDQSKITKKLDITQTADGVHFLLDGQHWATLSPVENGLVLLRELEESLEKKEQLEHARGNEVSRGDFIQNFLDSIEARKICYKSVSESDGLSTLWKRELFHGIEKGIEAGHMDEMVTLCSIAYQAAHMLRSFLFDTTDVEKKTKYREAASWFFQNKECVPVLDGYRKRYETSKDVADAVNLGARYPTNSGGNAGKYDISGTNKIINEVLVTLKGVRAEMIVAEFFTARGKPPAPKQDSQSTREVIEKNSTLAGEHVPHAAIVDAATRTYHLPLPIRIEHIEDWTDLAIVPIITARPDWYKIPVFKRMEASGDGGMVGTLRAKILEQLRITCASKESRKPKAAKIKAKVKRPKKKTPRKPPPKRRPSKGKKLASKIVRKYPKVTEFYEQFPEEADAIFRRFTTALTDKRKAVGIGK